MFVTPKKTRVLSDNSRKSTIQDMRAVQFNRKQTDLNRESDKSS